MVFLQGKQIMNNKRVLILANNDMGLYKFRKELLIELVKECDVLISVPIQNFEGELLDIGVKLKDIKINRRGKNPLKDFLLLCKYFVIILKYKPDIILTYTIKPNIYGGLISRILRKKNIANITGLGSSENMSNTVKNGINKLYKTSLKKAGYVFFQNESNLEYFRSKEIYTGNYGLIPGSGVNTTQYGLKEYPKTESIQFTYISRIMYEKGIDNYLNTAKYMKDKYSNVVFNVVGFCEENYIEILNELHTKGIIKYHGLVKDVRKIISLSHCIIHPSFYPEGMSNVLLEASSMGRPVITTRQNGCMEIVKENITGFLIEKNNYDELIEKVEYFYHMPAEKKLLMGINASSKVSNEFNRTYVVNKYLTEIKKLW